MPHSERIKSAYLRSTALCVAVGGAVSGAAVPDGMLARKPKYAKISRIDSVCQGAAIRRRSGGGGVGVCVCVGGMVTGWSFMRLANRRYTKIWADTQGRKEKLQPRRLQDLGSISTARYARDRREILRRYAPQDDGRNECLASVLWRLAVQREPLHVPIEAVQRVVSGDHGAAARQQG